MNDKPCKTCQHYWPLVKPSKKDVPINTNRGHCLKKSIFPSNKPGDIVYPPGAILKELPHGRGKPYIVKNTDVVTTCTVYNAKE